MSSKLEQKHQKLREGQKKNAEMMNSLEITPNSEQLKERGHFRASDGCCQILEDCFIKEVAAGGSVKSENKCSDSKLEMIGQMVGKWSLRC